MFRPRRRLAPGSLSASALILLAPLVGCAASKGAVAAPAAPRAEASPPSAPSTASTPLPPSTSATAATAATTGTRAPSAASAIDAAPPSLPAPAPDAKPAPAAGTETAAPLPSASKELSGAEPPTHAGEPSASGACPEDMVLIDGDYCTNLAVKCKKSHYAEQNKKIICEEFEPRTECTGQKVHRRYCIDRYEWPNKKGELPEVMHDFPAAQKLCAKLGKRVCTESEWTMACEGPEYKPFPYGYVRDPNKCRGDRPYRDPRKSKDGGLLTHTKDKAKAKAEQARLYDAVPSGSQPECVSDYGVYDMPGNADELAASEGREGVVYSTMTMPDGHLESIRSKDLYDNVTTGGPWVSGVRNQCRPKIYTHNEGFSYYYLAFRCCAEADGKATDPRAPRQLQRNEKWK